MKKTSIILLSVLFLFSCAPKNKFEADVSDIKVQLTAKRLDKDLFAYEADKFEVHIANLQKGYKAFFNIYNFKILKIGLAKDSLYTFGLKQFLQYCKKYDIYTHVQQKYGTINPVMEDVNNAFKHYKYHFPDKKLPEIYTYISGYNTSVIIAEGMVGISLDRYLGPKYENYSKLGIEQYRQERMYKGMIQQDMMKAVLLDDYPYEFTADDMLENMIYEGKIQYALMCMIPNAPDSVKFGYSNEKVEWVKKNEANIWKHFLDKKLLFSIEKNEIRQYIGDGPFTTPFSKISAPRAGAYIGFKIVESYMDRNSDISLKQLMEEKDYRKIYQKSLYNPKE